MPDADEAEIRNAMLKPDRDEPRWTINGHTMRAEGPWLKNEGRVEVVPAELLGMALEALQTIAARPYADRETAGRIARNGLAAIERAVGGW